MLAVYPEAQGLHEAGLQAGLRGDFATAHGCFAAALELLDPLAVTVDKQVQSARLRRDDGFSYIRQAIHDEAPTLLEHAQNALNYSIEITAPLVSGTSLLSTHRLQRHDVPKPARREVFAEHGASLSLLGRLATVKTVMLGVDTRTESLDARETRSIDQQPYGLAHDMLRLGSNGYYRVSNAMAGARQERLNGRPAHMRVWLFRAGQALAWTAIHDPANLKPAISTAGQRTPHLRSYSKALESVLSNP